MGIKTFQIKIKINISSENILLHEFIPLRMHLVHLEDGINWVIFTLC